MPFSFLERKAFLASQGYFFKLFIKASKIGLTLLTHSALVSFFISLSQIKVHLKFLVATRSQSAKYKKIGQQKTLMLYENKSYKVYHSMIAIILSPF